jgi:hypothetical protein
MIIRIEVAPPTKGKYIMEGSRMIFASDLAAS